MDYSNSITLVKNKRGCYDFDTIKGCASGMFDNPFGCYNDCYAFRAAQRYGFNFGKSTLRGFDNRQHQQTTITRINKIDMPFVRIGVTGDPSENWEHTLDICHRISVDTQLSLFPKATRGIVIVTKHWQNLTKRQLKSLANLNICVNTSVSALDKPTLLRNRLTQYNRLKGYCKSILRIVSCDFNLHNAIGRKLDLIQRRLFDNENVLDTILRVGAKNELVLSGVINIAKLDFLNKSCWVSRLNKNTYLGKCSSCPEMCGLL